MSVSSQGFSQNRGTYLAAKISSPKTITATGRWEFLDSLRAIAALLVMIEHWMEMYTPRANTLLWHFFSPGAMGVATFFLVSGFIIPVSLEKYGSLRTFWIGRFFRLFPLYFFSMGLEHLLRLLGVSPQQEAHIPIWRSIMGNGLMAQELFHIPYPISVYWSLSFELVFYLCCSFLFLFGTLSKSRRWSLVASGAFLLSTLAVGLIFHKPLSAEKAGVVVTAFFGTALYRYATNSETSNGVLMSGTLFTTAIVVSFWFRLAHFTKSGDYHFPGYVAMVSAWVLGTCLFLFCLASRQREFPKILLWAGKISYSIYLMHPLVLEICRGRINAIVSIPVFLFGTLLVSQITFSMVESPFQKLQHKLFPRRAKLAAPSLTTVVGT